MHCGLRMVGTWLAVVTLLSAASLEAQESQPGREVLDQLVGVWDIKITVKNAFGSEHRYEVVETRRWSEEGGMLHCSIPRSAEGLQPEYHLMLRYDVSRKTYPGVLFSENDRALVDATWDASKKSLRFQGKLADGNQFEFVYRFLEDGSIESTGSVKDAGGGVFVERADRQTRRP